MIDRALERRLPDAAAVEAVGAPRIPRFLRHYTMGGIGPEVGLARNRAALDAVCLMPRYLVEEAAPDLTFDKAGLRLLAPFGVAPMGLGGLIWPGSEEAIARAMGAAGLAHALSTVATTAVEVIAPLAGAGRMFQLYSLSDPGLDAALMARVRDAGYDTLIVTVDVPGATRRRRDIQSGLSFPPRFTLATLMQMAASPRWLAGQAGRGIPAFQNILPFLPKAGVTEQQWRILRVLDEHGPMPITAIGELACLQAPSLSRTIQILVEKEMVRRVRDTSDRRRQTISLAEAGAAVIYSNIGESRRIARAFEERLGPEKHRRLLDLLDELSQL